MKIKTKAQLIDWVFTMYLQNLSGREDFDEAFKIGIENTIDELEELNLFKIGDDILNNCCDLALKWFELNEQNDNSIKFIGINDYIKQNINGKKSNNNND